MTKTEYAELLKRPEWKARSKEIKMTDKDFKERMITGALTVGLLWLIYKIWYWCW